MVVPAALKVVRLKPTRKVSSRFHHVVLLGGSLEARDWQMMALSHDGLRMPLWAVPIMPMAQLMPAGALSLRVGVSLLGKVGSYRTAFLLPLP